MFDQQAAHPQGNAVLAVGREATFPEGLGDDAEHGAAVELLPTGLNRVDAPATQRTRIEQRKRNTHAR